MNPSDRKAQEVIEFIDLRIKELDSASDINQINSIGRHIELTLNTDLSYLPELFYFYKFREKTDNFELAASKDIDALKIIIGLLI